MAEFLKTPKSVILPTLENIKDEEIKKVFEKYNRVIDEFVISVYSDLAWLHEKIYKLENP